MATCHVCGRTLGMFPKKCRMCGKFACYENRHLVKDQGGDICVVCYEKVHGPRKKGGCFITSSVIESTGLPDDCDILQNMRKLRDEYLLIDSCRSHYVDTYYSIAPTIVDAINNMLDSKHIYQKLLDDYIIPTSKLVDEGKMEEAMHKYLEMVKYAQIISKIANN